MTEALDPLAAALADRYTIERRLGTGGMAHVYLARDLRHERLVALKVLRPELGAVLGSQRFLTEIRTTAQLVHPHILPLLDSGEAAGLLWYTMPYVEGESLRERLQRETQLAIPEAVRLAHEVALALQAAHRRGIIHRDIKPENILLQDGTALVADFGIALAMREAGGTRLTESGFSLGTPQYMSPEQASGRQVDPRTDVYSLGAVLYEMLAGVAPHTGPTVPAIIARLMSENPTPIRTLRTTVSQELAELVHRSLAKTPADRYPTAGAMAEALSAPALTSAPPELQRMEGPTPGAAELSPQGKPWRWSRRALRVAVLVLVLGGVALLVTRQLGNAPDARATRLLILPMVNETRPDLEWLASGLTDEITTYAASMSGLSVIARASAERLKGTTQSLHDLGRDLDVPYLLTSTLRAERETDSARVVAALVRAADETEVWSTTVHVSLGDPRTVETQVITRVGDGLRERLRAGKAAKLARSSNPEAYQLYLQAADPTYSFALSSERVQESERLLEQATQLDPKFAAAHGRLALLRTYWIWFGEGKLDQRTEQVEEAANRALALDSSERYARLAEGIRLMALNRMDDAQSATEAVLRDYPDDPTALLTRGTVALCSRKYDAARQALERVIVVNPLVADNIATLAVLELEATGKLDRVIPLYDRAIRLWQEDFSRRDLQWNVTRLRRIAGDTSATARLRTMAQDTAFFRVMLGVGSLMPSMWNVLDEFATEDDWRRASARARQGDSLGWRGRGTYFALVRALFRGERTRARDLATSLLPRLDSTRLSANSWQQLAAQGLVAGVAGDTVVSNRYLDRAEAEGCGTPTYFYAPIELPLFPAIVQVTNGDTAGARAGLERMFATQRWPSRAALQGHPVLGALVQPGR
jgi:TolB-like protein/tetratricopeptide (TPR) repeat protein